MFFISLKQTYALKQNPISTDAASLVRQRLERIANDGREGKTRSGELVW
jgi:hypothetical protein